LVCAFNEFNVGFYAPLNVTITKMTMKASTLLR